MLLPWTSQKRLAEKRVALDEEIADLRSRISAKKAEIKQMERDLYWGEISIGKMKTERKGFVGMQKRIRKAKKELRKIDERLGGSGPTSGGEPIADETGVEDANESVDER